MRGSSTPDGGSRVTACGVRRHRREHVGSLSGEAQEGLGAVLSSSDFLAVGPASAGRTAPGPSGGRLWRRVEAHRRSDGSRLRPLCDGADDSAARPRAGEYVRRAKALDGRRVPVADCRTRSRGRVSSVLPGHLSPDNRTDGETCWSGSTTGSGGPWDRAQVSPVGCRFTVPRRDRHRTVGHPLRADGGQSLR